MKSYFLYLIIALFPAPVSGQHLFMFISEDDQPQPVQLLSIDGRGIDVLDPDTGHQTYPTSNCLALIRPVPRSTAGEFSYIELKDGQVFFGRPGESSTSESITLNHQWFGEMQIPVDEIHRIVFGQGDVAQEPDAGGFDQVSLRNGDELSGFVSALSDPIVIEVDRGDKTEDVHVPWSRVNSVQLFGELKPPTFPRVWLEDGTIVTLEDIVVDDDWRLQVGSHGFNTPPTAAPSGSNPPDIDAVRVVGPSISDIHAIVFADRSVHALGDAHRVSVETPEIRITKPGPDTLDASAILGLSPLSASGPASISWAIPEGVDVFRTTARLTKSMMAWGNLDIEVLINAQSVMRVHMDAESPEAFLLVPVEAGELTIVLHEGLNGPVQDTVILEYPMFFQRVSSPDDEV